MPVSTVPYAIEALAVPARLDAPDAADFHDYAELCDALELQTWGNLDRSFPAGARLAYLRDTDYTRQQHFVVRQNGRMVATSFVQTWLQENTRLALFHVHVLADFAGRGIGTALLRHAEELALAKGRTILQSYTEHPADFDPGGPGLVRPATGSGALPAAAPAVRFALRAGYRLEQVERFSTLTLPPPGTVLDALEDDALARAGETYELLHWTDRCPDALAGELAALMARMSTDVPSGGLNYDAETWDAARLRDLEDTWEQAGQTSLIAAARHRASGALAAYSVLQVSAGKPWLASQEDTLVAAGHRGHRLGTLVKILNLRRLSADHPEVRRVITFNAAENEHMLAINTALGFRPAGYDGEWQRLAAPGGGPETPPEQGR